MVLVITLTIALSFRFLRIFLTKKWIFKTIVVRTARTFSNLFQFRFQKALYVVNCSETSPLVTFDPDSISFSLK